jgi:hypothetical protein
MRAREYNEGRIERLLEQGGQGIGTICEIMQTGANTVQVQSHLARESQHDDLRSEDEGMKKWSRVLTLQVVHKVTGHKMRHGGSCRARHKATT